MSFFETIKSCPVCAGTAFSPFLSCKDYLVSGKEFAVQSCNNCGFRLTNPRPDTNSIGQYYKSDNYISHSDNGRGVVNTVYKGVRSYTLRAKLALINSLVTQKGRLLDVGCGIGSFLEVCQNNSWAIAGMEPDADARRIASDKLGSPIAADIASVSEDRYDIITLWHVLEHIAELESTINRFHELLNESGTLLIAVPNSDSYDADLFGEYWAAYDVPRHLHHFTPKTIKALFGKHGFRLIDQKPMIFDAFYISLLSTQYQTGKTSYVRSIQAGLKSNWQAKKTGNWSSLIYMFKK